MPQPRHMPLVNKAVDACIAAIEIYNKPDFRYREEAFAILMLNAWELLLKARIIKANKGDGRSIIAMEPIALRGGGKGKRLVPKRNRSGNPLTIGLGKCAELVRQYPNDSIDQHCIENLDLLVEIRDNAVHLRNIDPGLGRRIQEVGSAALRNFAHGAQRWFSVDLSRYNFYLMPLAFHSPLAVFQSLAAAKQPAAARKLLACIADAEKQHPSDEKRDYNVTLQVELKFVRTKGADAIPVQVSREAGALPVRLSEEDIRQAFPWDYRTFIRRLKVRFSDFVANNAFYKLKAKIEADERFSKVRYLDPANPKSGQKRFYNPNILSEFDRHYTKK